MGFPAQNLEDPRNLLDGWGTRLSPRTLVAE
ncbi:hypothetical protein NONI108955_23995 [Nocardia ninae]